MAATYTWHPRFDVTNARWPLARTLLEDELLSSWLVRNAFAHGCPPLVLTGHLWPRWRCWTVDIDRGLTLDQSQRLSWAAGIPISAVSSCTLRSIAHRISPWLIDRTAVWPWILTVGQRNRRHAGGLQCCPFCLEEGVPYYRMSWRLAWHTCCEKHRVRLIDSCPGCGVPLQPHRLALGNPDLAKCFSCGHLLLSRLETLGFDPAALAFQIDANNSLSGDLRATGMFGEPQQWFYHSRVVWGLLRAAAIKDSKALSRLREVFGIGALSPPGSGLPLEMLPVTDRMSFLGAVWKVMAFGPSALYDAILESSMTRTALALPIGECPDALQAVVDELPLPRHHTKANPSLTKHAKPRAVVMKMWSRVKRKILRDV